MSDLTYFILAMIFNYAKYTIVIVVSILLFVFFGSVWACGVVEMETININCIGCL